MIMKEPKRFNIEPFFLDTKNPKGFFYLEPFTDSKYVTPIEPFKVLYRTFSSKSA